MHGHMIINKLDQTSINLLNGVIGLLVWNMIISAISSTQNLGGVVKLPFQTVHTLTKMQKRELKVTI
jgi:hypothetical protein